MLISLRVIPRSDSNRLEWDGDGLKAHLTASPVDGAANKALIALLADQLSVPKRMLSIVRGATSRQKVIQIENFTPELLKCRFPRP